MNKRLATGILISVIVVGAAGVAATLALRTTPSTSSPTLSPTPTAAYPDFAVAPENLQLARNVYNNCLVTGAELLVAELRYRLTDACHADALLQAGAPEFMAVSEPGYATGGSLDAETRVTVRGQEKSASGPLV